MIHCFNPLLSTAMGSCQLSTVNCQLMKMADLTNPNSTSQLPISAENSSPTSPQPPTVLRCVTGSLMAGGFAAALYVFTLSIAQTFANKPIHSDNVTVINIAAAVRTLVMGIVALGGGVFAFASVGLMLLAVQLLIQKFAKKTTA